MTWMWIVSPAFVLVPVLLSAAGYWATWGMHIPSGEATALGALFGSALTIALAVEFREVP